MSRTVKGTQWDLTDFFHQFDNATMRRFKDALERDVHAARLEIAVMKPITSTSADEWEALILKIERLGSRLGHFSAYIGCLEAADARSDVYSRERAVITALYAELEKVEVDLIAALAQPDKARFKAFCNRDTLAPIAYTLQRTREKARFMMSRDKELLGADLNVDGLHAWGRLYDKIAGQLEFTLKRPDGRTETKPISQWRALMAAADRDLGRAAFEGGNQAWAGVQEVCAAALNAIAGTRLNLNRHRKIPQFLDVALFQAGIERKTLEAMYTAIHEQLKSARDILRAKAGFFGRNGIWFFEREAPLPLQNTQTYTWQTGVDLVQQAITGAYPDLAAFFEQILENRWIESEPRPGKRPGAFCTGSTLNRQQRVYMTYGGSLSDITTLAHEVGHAWHGHLMRDMRPWAQDYPMPLAETASIFTEQLLVEGILADPQIESGQKLLMLDADLSNAAVMLLDITTRFNFETKLYEERSSREISISRLKDLMTQTQQEVFGDALLADGADPLFWASKLHFYITDITFYNFPYTFGFLLARALLRMYREQKREFLPKYETFLTLTGSASVEEVAARGLGVDISTPAFWRAAIEDLQPRLDEYRDLISRHRS